MQNSPSLIVCGKQPFSGPNPRQFDEAGELTGGGPGSERDATTPSSVEDKKPVIGGSGPPSNCATGNGLIKSETDFLDTFDSKDGGKCQHSFFFSNFPITNKVGNI